eukprot:TRINITY_DN10824_c1_g1_i1.p1 TRINITY_DN10824_c1_g1~~TRINITY_DN10824_c1_g1_i1.p1  ORF type:complete len:379 (+),score=51.64 TRINITY_DN10824_c1_g1_i1:1046-2182(+)
MDRCSVKRILNNYIIGFTRMGVFSPTKKIPGRRGKKKKRKPKRVTLYCNSSPTRRKKSIKMGRPDDVRDAYLKHLVNIMRTDNMQKMPDEWFDNHLPYLAKGLASLRGKLKKNPNGQEDIKRVEATLKGDIESAPKEEKIFCMQAWVATLVPKSNYTWMSELTRPYLALVIKLLCPLTYPDDTDPPTAKNILMVKIELWYDDQKERLAKKASFEEPTTSKEKPVKKLKHEAIKITKPVVVKTAVKSSPVVTKPEDQPKPTTPVKQAEPEMKQTEVVPVTPVEEKEVINKTVTPPPAEKPAPREPTTEVAASPTSQSMIAAIATRIKNVLETGATQVKTIAELALEFESPNSDVLAAARMMQKHSDIYLDESLGVLYLV